jgi:hypothetical protein
MQVGEQEVQIQHLAFHIYGTFSGRKSQFIFADVISINKDLDDAIALFSASTFGRVYF